MTTVSNWNKSLKVGYAFSGLVSLLSLAVKSYLLAVRPFTNHINPPTMMDNPVCNPELRRGFTAD